jgi:hypothetical protein
MNDFSTVNAGSAADVSLIKGTVCDCDDGWTGDQCDIQRCPDDCTHHGLCVAGEGEVNITVGEYITEMRGG